jgi:hypothetical protein
MVISQRVKVLKGVGLSPKRSMPRECLGMFQVIIALELSGMYRAAKIGSGFGEWSLIVGRFAGEQSIVPLEHSIIWKAGEGRGRGLGDGRQLK